VGVSAAVKGRNMERKTVALLFSDVVGYSMLNEPQLKVFLEKILPQIAALREKDIQSFIEINTWGDGLIIASDNPYPLARFALSLRDFFKNYNWTDDHLPALSSRIALHMGVVFTGDDPIRKTEGIIGTQVNVAARIEPVTTPGEVWVTPAFVNLIDTKTDPTLAFDNIGTRSLAKAFGCQLLYRLRRYHEPESLPPQCEAAMQLLKKLTILAVYPDQSSDPKIVYKLKLRIIIRNDTGHLIHVKAPTWNPGQGGIAFQGLNTASWLQVEGGAGWRTHSWEREGSEVDVEAGKVFRTWIGLDPSRSTLDVIALHESHQLGAISMPVRVAGCEVVFERQL
jgi:class 3 adenylate cyclase